MENNTILADRMLGCLFGQAIGDALGLGSEGMSVEEVHTSYPTGLTYYNQIIDDCRRKGIIKGSWTDDTHMMLCILEAFCRDGNLEATTLARLFIEGYDNWGETCGILTRKVLNFMPPVYLQNPIAVSKLVWELKGRDNAPNGGLMRTSIIGIWPFDTETNAETACKMTHFDPRCVGSCVVVSALIHSLIWEERDLVQDDMLKIAAKYDNRISEWIDLAYQAKEIAELQPDHADSMAYTLRTLAIALWAFLNAQSFEEGLLAVVNAGGDADTNAAVACAILGAKFGYSTIPEYYIKNLHNSDAYRRRCNGFISKIPMGDFNLQ